MNPIAKGSSNPGRSSSPPRWYPRRGWWRALLPVILAVFFLWWRAFLTPDALFLLLLAVMFVYGLAFQFLVRFVPFLGLLLSYDALRGLVPFLNNHVHIDIMADFDRWLGGGTLPTLTLQHWLYHGHLRWYDFYFYFLYMFHFVAPVLLGVLIWRLRPWAYWRYVWTLLTLSYAGFLAFLIFPAAPPWLAADRGHIPMIEKLSGDIWSALGVHNFPTLYAKFEPNPVAAVPSLHAAYPLLVVLFIQRLFGWRWALPALIYPVSVWLGVVYMGEHYVFDVLAGIVFALASFWGVDLVARWYRLRKPVPRLNTEASS